MKVTHHELTLQLWDLLTKAEIEEGSISITRDCGVNTSIRISDHMAEDLLECSPWRDHIVGFKRDTVGIDIILDEEGQSKWNGENGNMCEWIAKNGCE